MQNLPRSAFATALVLIGLSACDPEPPLEARVPARAEPKALGADATPADTVQDILTDSLRDPDAYSRARRLGTLLPTLGAEHVAAVKQTLGDTTLDLGATELELLVRFWATQQPEEASRWAVEQSPPGYRIAAVMSSLTLWAAADPQAAAGAAQQWAARIDVRDAVLIALVRGWFATDPSELAQFIHDIGMGFPRQRALSTYIRATIQQHGIDAATRWAESLPDDDAPYKLAAYRQVGSVLPLFDHEAGLRWCDTHCEGPYGNNLRSILARRWARSDGAAALEWLSHAPESHDNRLAVRATFALWGELDREAVLDWMATQTTGELEAWLVPTLPVYARLLAEDSPADAIEWAERIEGAEEREIVLIAVARAWRQLDEAATDAWLLQSQLSEQAQEKVRAPNG